MEKSFRIHTNITGDTFVNVNMKQEFDFLEILSLKLRQKDAYRLHSSNYGVIVGRVLANDAFGIPNAKVSVFIERDTSDPNEMRDIYPYSEVMSKDDEGRRYNLLPDYSDDSCYRVVGTFPRKRYLLDDDVQLDIYDKYWKYTTVTNQAGDYMIFGIPAGSQQIHVDIDLSDIGILSQKPRDFIFKGHNIDEFDSPSQFKESTNLDGLQQIISQNKATVVYPFWGDPENGIAAITRCDVQINYKFEPTCVFMGSIISDNEGNAIGHRCDPSVNCGMNNQLVAGEGTIEMIRKTTDGLVEEFPIKGNALIDSDGVWCYQIPMNLDFVGTDEYGNIVPTDNPSKGLPTRAQVRFRISKTESGDEGFSRHTAKYLVPMNPIMKEDGDYVIPTTQETSGSEMEKMYNFGSNTPLSCFRDLYWDNVYSVKNFIPRIQTANKVTTNDYGGLKGANLVENQNPVPFNKLRVDLPFSFMIVCILFTIVMIIVVVINTVIQAVQAIRGLCLPKIPLIGRICPFKLIIPKMGCVALNAGLGDGGNTAFYPGCGCPSSEACKNSSCPEGMEGNCSKSSNNSDLKDRVQQALALDYKMIKLDFYQDWLNGSLYMPLWYWRKAKKKKFLFFTISGAKNEYCSCDKSYSRLKTYVGCSIEYNNNSLGTDDGNTSEGENRWHKSRKHKVYFKNGIIKSVENKDGLKVYYYTGFQPSSADSQDIPIERRKKSFKFIRLYATDIILLGNLNENNLYGIPQFFTSLPSTTANIPPIATVQQALSDNDTDGGDTVGNSSEDSGYTITTGMDWGYNGGGQTPNYKDGLFMDLACTYAGTKAKSCINVERLSEFGVNLDSSYSMSYAYNSSDLKTGTIESDGFVTKLELDDLENRATFATLNHIGFIPQDYQDSIGAYTTQVPDENTGYLVPKFKYVYPVDFDGRMQPIMKRYKNGFEQAMYDEPDQSYITFRLGAEESNTNTENLEGRIRHFYHEFNMPLYNNSFYFYFGINKGNTAIDKFNKLFYAPCFQRNKAPFSFDIDSMGKSYCPSTYGTSNKAYNGYGYIRFTSDNIVAPFSYTLLDSSSNVVVPTEKDMIDTDFVIGGKIEEDGTITMNENGIVKYQLTDEPVSNQYGLSGLTNQVYTLEITDGNGRKMSHRIELKVPKISLDYDSEGLKAKFYNTTTTRRDFICSEENKYYGIIRIKTFSIDGAAYYITDYSLTYSSSSKLYNITLTGVSKKENSETTEPGNTATCVVKFSSVAAPSVKNCMCENLNWHNKVDPTSEGGDKPFTTLHTYWIKMLVYQPNRFSLQSVQLCGSKELSENSSSDVVTVLNGENFNTFLNDMPVKFMLGTTTDSAKGTIANASKFYSNTSVTNTTDSHISGWYGVHQEDTYRWDMTENQVLKRNQDTWGDFVETNGDITKHDTKGRILEYKFNCMFSLSSVVYVANDSASFYYTAVGGVTPTLYRSVVPKYSDLEALKHTYVLSDNNMASGQALYPNIVGVNYALVNEDMNNTNKYVPYLNPYISDREYLGNYFAAFTNNGGYISKTAVNSSLKVVKIPTNAKVSPQSAEKKMGKDVDGAIGSTFRYARTYGGDSSNPSSLPYLRAMFIDRRLDFDMILFAPCTSNNTTSLYPSTDSGKEKIWRSARISGFTYNGIEMSYDADYNVISANTSDDGTSASTNTRLEYSYYYSDGDSDAKTVYNSETDMIWESDTYDVYEKDDEGNTRYDVNGNPIIQTLGDKERQIIKRLYEATFVGRDIRNFFWSTFNKNRLNQHASSSENSINNYMYVYKYPGTGTTQLFNGDFNRLNVISNKNYPTRRFIDIGNIESNGEYDLNLVNCSYSMNCHYNNDGTITAEADEGNSVEITTSFETPIAIMPPSNESDDYSNVLYSKGKKSNGYTMFTTSAMSITFSINPSSNDNYSIYAAAPKLIKVLPFRSGSNLDGISYIKTVTPTGEIQGGAKGSVYNAIDAVTLKTFNRLTENPITLQIPLFNHDTVVPPHIHIEEMWGEYKKNKRDTYSDYYFNGENGRTYLTTDSAEFKSIYYGLNNFNIAKSNTYMFAILVEKLYESKSENNLTNELITFEFSEIFDARPIYIKLDSASNTGNTYVEVRKIEVIEDETENNDTGGGTSNDDEPVEETYTISQIMTFEINFPYNADPANRACETIGNAGMVSYSMILKNSNEEVFRLTPSSVESEIQTSETGEPIPTADTKLKLSFRWSQDMGLMQDSQWRNKTTCSLIAKTGSNFVYKLSEFSLKFKGQQSVGTDPDTKYYTDAEIL